MPHEITLSKLSLPIQSWNVLSFLLTFTYMRFSFLQVHNLMDYSFLLGTRECTQSDLMSLFSAEHHNFSRMTSMGYWVTVAVVPTDAEREIHRKNQKGKTSKKKGKKEKEKDKEEEALHGGNEHPEQSAQGHPNICLYYFGIIDVLEAYTVKKRVSKFHHLIAIVLTRCSLRWPIW